MALLILAMRFLTYAYHETVNDLASADSQLTINAAKLALGHGYGASKTKTKNNKVLHTVARCVLRGDSRLGTGSASALFRPRLTALARSRFLQVCVRRDHRVDRAAADPLCARAAGAPEAHGTVLARERRRARRVRRGDGGRRRAHVRVRRGRRLGHVPPFKGTSLCIASLRFEMVKLLGRERAL
jgi:hypothetical protein